MRTIIIWQSTQGPVLVDKETATRIENCREVEFGPLRRDTPLEGTLFLWPEEVFGTVQHGLEPGLERVLIEFAPLFPSVLKSCNGMPRDFVLPLTDDLEGDES